MDNNTDDGGFWDTPAGLGGELLMLSTVDVGFDVEFGTAGRGLRREEVNSVVLVDKSCTGVGGLKRAFMVRLPEVDLDRAPISKRPKLDCFLI